MTGGLWTLTLDFPEEQWLGIHSPVFSVTL